jgi:hypothetical protein
MTFHCIQTASEAADPADKTFVLMWPYSWLYCGAVKLSSSNSYYAFAAPLHPPPNGGGYIEVEMVLPK